MDKTTKEAEEQPTPKTEARPWPALGAKLYQEVLARCQRDLDEVVEMIAAEMGVSPAEGWHADAHRSQFIRHAPPGAPD